jgi:hypothetical protein
MHSPQLTHIAAQQHINELHRTAAYDRFVRPTGDVRRPDTENRRRFARRFRRFLADAQPVSR